MILILTFVLVWYSWQGNVQSTNITKAEFVVALQTGKVDAVKVTQNAEVPTGRLTILLDDETTKTMYVSNVNEIQELMDENGFGNYYCENVPQKSWLESLLPYLLIFGI